MTVPAVGRGALPASSGEEPGSCAADAGVRYIPASDYGSLLVTWAAGQAFMEISGEIDLLNYSALAQTLGRLTAGVGTLHVSLAGLTFCDLGGLRVIVGLAAGGGDGRRVVMHEVPPQIMMVLGIVGWDSAPGLVLHGRGAARCCDLAALSGRRGTGSLADAGTGGAGSGRRPRWPRRLFGFERRQRLPSAGGGM
jgi:anti-anti-sigma regulatory factor